MKKNDIKNYFVFEDFTSKESRFYFDLATHFQAQNVNNCKVFSFLSARKGEGKSTTLVNLAYALSKKKKCLMIDMDFSSPSLDNFFNLTNDLKLEEFYQQKMDLKNIIKNVRENLDLISFEKCDFTSEFDLQTLFSKLIGFLKEKYDYIFIDVGSTINAVEYTFIESFVLCVRENVATKKDLKGIMKIVNNYHLNLLFTLYINGGF